jgi:hypothetical protein
MVMQKVSPRPMTLDSFAIGGLTTAKMIVVAVLSVPKAESWLKSDVA